ncbi:MAG: hypothetical protein H7338_14115 [Candidatus Sericytochromatia bacterium]|nr:hypothetical protein [Candidatus Sericytochromatia bacterium]
MPRLNRLRVTNIRYDGDAKQLPDMLFEARGENLLVVLANGGGKTLLLHLLLQTVLPNCALGPRKIGDLLQHARYTGHVLAEWLLDGHTASYLLTGFCFSNAKDDDKPLEYFSYTHAYTEANPFDITQIPLFPAGGQPIDAPSLRLLLKGARLPRLHVFATRREYQEELAQYQLYRDEWESILTTNGSEGGAGLFFEKARTTRQLLEQILIPAVESAQYETEAERQELSEAFRRHRDDLMQIPVIHRNIRDYAAMITLSQPLQAIVSDHARMQAEIATAQAQLLALEAALQQELVRIAAAVGDVHQDMEGLRRRRREIDWQLAWYPIYCEHLARTALQREVTQKAIDCTQAEHAVHTAQRVAAELQALVRHAQLRQAENRALTVSQQLADLDREAPELQADFDRERRYLAHVWQAQAAIVQQHADTAKERLAVIAAAKHDLFLARRTNEQERARLAHLIGGVDQWLKSLDEAQSQFAVRFGPEAAAAPRTALASWELDIADIATREQASKALLGDLQRQAQAATETLLAVAVATASTRHASDALAGEQQTFEAAESGYQGRLAQWQIALTTDVLADRETVQLALRNQIERTRSERHRLIVRLGKLSETSDLMSGRTWMVSHPELLRLQERLAAVDLHVVPGSEWLAAQPLSDADKRQVVRHCPLLPFAIVAEPAQIGRLRRELARSPDWPWDFPLLIIPRRDDLLRAGDEDGDFLTLADQAAWVFQPESQAVYWSADALQAWQDGLETQVQEAEAAASTLQAQLEPLENLDHGLKTFYARYPSGIRRTWDEEAARRQATHTAQTAEAATLNNRRQAWLLQSDALTVALDDLGQQRTQRLLDCGQLRPFAERMAERVGQRIERARLAADQQARLDDAEAHTRQATQWQDDERKQEQQHRDAKTEQSLLMQVKLQFLADDPPPVETAMAYDACLATVAGRHEALTQRQGNRSSLESERQLYREQVIEYRRELGRIGAEWSTLTEAWCAENQRLVTDEAIDMQKRQVRLAEARRDQLKGEEQDLSRKQAGLDSRIATLEHQAQTADTELDPYLAFDPIGHRTEHDSLQDRSTLALTEQTRLDALLKGHQQVKETLLTAATVLGGDAEDRLGWTVGIGAWTEDAAEALRAAPVATAQKGQKRVQQLERERERLSDKVMKALSTFLDGLKACQNPRLGQFIRETEIILGQGRIFDHPYVLATFASMTNAIDAYRQECQVQLEQLDRNRQELVLRALKRALAMYHELGELPKNSRISLYEQSVQLFRLELPHWQDEAAHERMARHIDDQIATLGDLQGEGKGEDERNRHIVDALSVRRLLDRVISLDKIRLLVFKPRQEAILRSGRPDLARWDEVISWSGGEKYCVYMNMFMSIITHLRQRVSQSRLNWKFLAADNPFGAASSAHVLDPVFAMATTNKIQLFCITALKEEGLQRHFKAVYSLRLLPAYGKEILKAEQIESGFYRHVEPPQSPEIKEGGR